MQRRVVDSGAKGQDTKLEQPLEPASLFRRYAWPSN